MWRKDSAETETESDPHDNTLRCSLWLRMLTHDQESSQVKWKQKNAEVMFKHRRIDRTRYGTIKKTRGILAIKKKLSEKLLGCFVYAINGVRPAGRPELR